MACFSLLAINPYPYYLTNCYLFVPKSIVYFKGRYEKNLILTVFPLTADSCQLYHLTARTILVP